jgi:hypothetical protein
MRAQRQCPKCAGDSLWNVRGMHHHEGPLETLICAACGYTAWYAEAAGRLQLQRVFDDQLRCLDCGGDELHVEELNGWSAEERLARVALGMAVMVCSCGRCEWVRGVGAGGDAPVADERSCPRCLEASGSVLYPVYEDGLRALPVAIVGKTRIGAFELRWCGSCSLCEWFAHDLGALRADGKHVIFMEGDKRPDAPVAGGPYR